MKKRNWQNEKIVSIDFDGVISYYTGWEGTKVLGAPIKGAKEFVKSLIKKGFTPVIWSTRNKKQIKEWLKENNFPAIEITNKKYPSVVYIDDRCVQFNGNFSDLTKSLKKYDIYWRKKPKKIFEDF
ncbi:MAG: hypothetical protein PHE43_02080 [Candidatus Nanoarchaeia archaeon]|nr:hypothetical protein [Candidatus Nanoarchaeia archaeon]